MRGFWDRRFLEKAARAAPGVGPRPWVDAALLRQIPALPYRFYRVGKHAVLEQDGPRGYLCGAVDNAAELASFLGFAGIGTLVSDGFVPPGWAGDELCVMAWQGGRVAGDATPRYAMEVPEGFDPAPPPGEMVALLWEGEAQAAPDAQARYYASLCARLNHGYAHIVGLREAGRLVSVAGALCLTPWEAYLSAVQTRPEARGRGHASALVRQLCIAHSRPGTAVTLQCLPALIPFYQKLGFERLGTAWGSRLPEEPGAYETRQEQTDD